MSRIRPELTIDEAELAFSSGKPQDRQLINDYNMALEQYERSGEMDSTFKPGANVDHHLEFGYTIYQEFALLTESEFKGIIGAEPKELGMKSSKGKSFEHPVEWVSPGITNNMYLVSLDGLSQTEMAVVRKIRLEVKKAAIHADSYLRPSDQLLANQGHHVFGHVFKLMAEGRPMSASLQASLPESVASLRKKVNDKLEAEEATAAAFQQRNSEWLAKREHDASLDSFDKLMDSDGEEGEDAKAKMPRRQAGFAAGNVGAGGVPKHKKQRTRPKGTKGEVEAAEAEVSSLTSTAAPPTASTMPAISDAKPVGDAESSAAMSRKWNGSGCWKAHGQFHQMPWGVHMQSLSGRDWQALQPFSQTERGSLSLLVYWILMVWSVISIRYQWYVYWYFKY